MDWTCALLDIQAAVTLFGWYFVDQSPSTQFTGVMGASPPRLFSFNPTPSLTRAAFLVPSLLMHATAAVLFSLPVALVDGPTILKEAISLANVITYLYSDVSRWQS